jgi:FixJ family two-component response regulator
MTSNASIHPFDNLATIGCVTPEPGFRKSVETIVRTIGWRFWNVEKFQKTVQKCNDLRTNCLIVDMASVERPLHEPYESAFRTLPPTICVVEKGDVNAAIDATRAGAVNVLEKPVGQDELSTNIEIAVKLDQRCPTSGIEARFQHSRYSEFSSREKLILGMLVDGMKNIAVASRLELSLRTVEAVRSQILKKLNVRSFAQLVRLVAKLEYETRSQRIKEFERLLTASDFCH